MSTAPFDPYVADLVKGTHQVEATVAAVVPGQAPVPLQLIGGTVAWAEDRAPRVRADLTCAIPEEYDLPEGLTLAGFLNLLDPRLRVRLEVTVTYLLPTGVRDSHVVADLNLRARRVVRPAGVVELEAASDEALVIDASSPTLSTGDPTSVSYANGPAWIATNINQSLAWIGGPDPVPVVTAPVAAAQWNDGLDTWAAITDMADQLNVDVFDNGDRVFRIAPRPTIAGTPVHTIAAGEDGTLIDSDSTVARENWANYVILEYKWNTPTTAGKEFGSAKVTSGPYDPDAIGYKILYETRDFKSTAPAANKAAAAVLKKLLSRSRTLTTTSVAAWWVRPGHTITLDLPLGDPENHLVSWVEFDIANMTMTVGSRLPDTVSTVGE